MSLKAFGHDGSSIYNQEHITSAKFGFTSSDTLPGITQKELEDHEDETKTDDKVLRNKPEDGGNTLRYTFCFEQKATGHHMPSLHASKEPSRRIIFNVKFGTDAKTLEYYRQLAKEKHLSTTEQLFKAVEDQVSDVIKDIDDMRTRERRMDHLNKKTSALVLWYSLSACLFVVGGAVLSSFATQSFLMKRNIL